MLFIVVCLVLKPACECVFGCNEYFGLCHDALTCMHETIQAHMHTYIHIYIYMHVCMYMYSMILGKCVWRTYAYVYIFMYIYIYM